MENGNHNWTAQSSHGWVEDHGMPGNIFEEHELPHPDVQKASGINPDVYRSQHGLFVNASEVARPEFRGSETGSHPSAIHSSLGNVESFLSVVPEDVIEEGVEDVVPEKKTTRTAKK